MAHGRIVDEWQGTWLRVATERVTLPDGRVSDLDVVRHPGAACIAAFPNDDEVLLIRQFRYATGGEILELPAGKLEAGEEPADCARRELEEEAGVRAGRLEHLASIWTTPGFSDERLHLYAAYELEEVGQRLEPHEAIELVPTRFEEALAQVWSGAIDDAKTALGLLHAARRMGRLG
jgi:ADP-ribose pyrophosphatase